MIYCRQKISGGLLFMIYVLFAISVCIGSVYGDRENGNVLQEHSLGTALTPGHIGDDYAFWNDYSNGQIEITGPGRYYLTDDLISSSWDYSIKIESPDVTLDGNGKTISSNQRTLTGIDVKHPATHANISHCNVTGFRTGIYINGDYARIMNNALFRNEISGVQYTDGNYGVIAGNTAFENIYGIVLLSSGGDYSVIQDNEIFHNREAGIVNRGNSVSIVNNTVYENDYFGIISGGRDYGGEHPGPDGKGYYVNISHNRVFHNGKIGIGTGLPSARVLDNIVSNEQIGVFMTPRLNCSAQNNLIIENSVGFSSEYDDSLNLTLNRNKIINNSDSGIFIDGNSPVGNGFIFDNYFANNLNIETNGMSSEILWTNPSGPVYKPNIIEGPYVAGNYWSNPSGTGWSDVQPPSLSGYSLMPYEVVSGSGVYDTAPLVRAGQFINATSDIWTINYPQGNITYPRYTDAMYVTQAKPGAFLTDVIVDGIGQEVNETYLFPEIITDHTIETSGAPLPGQIHVMFTMSPETGNYPLVVQFKDGTIGVPTSWYWQFGDGSNSTEQNPFHTYTRPGIYSVSLRAFNEGTSGSAVCNECITVR